MNLGNAIVGGIADIGRDLCLGIINMGTQRLT